MSMTVQNIVDDARAKLGDTIYPYQWLVAYFYTPINDGIRALATQSPHCLYVSTVTTSLPSDVTAVGDTVLIIDEFRNKLVELVVVQLLQEDPARQREQTEGEPTP